MASAAIGAAGVRLRRLPGWLWFAPCFLLVVGGAAWRWPTLALGDDYMRVATARLAYSDVVTFYGGARNPLPYLAREVEYPVLAGLALWLAGFAPGGRAGYFLASAIILCAALLACLGLLLRMGAPCPAYFALAPPLALYGVLNWDALGLLGLVAAIYFARRGRFAAAGVALALGASAKLFPLFILPVLWAHTVALARPWSPGDGPRALWRRAVAAPPRRLLGGFAAAALAVNLPVLLLTQAGWSYFLRFQAGRPSNLDAIWTHLPAVPDGAQTVVLALVFVGGVGALTVRVLRGARWEVAALLSLLCFLLPTKVYSPQYDLWLLPLLALLAPPALLWYLFLLADLRYAWSVFHFYALQADGLFGADRAAALRLVGVGVWWREAALAAIFVWGLTQLRGAPTDRHGAAARGGDGASATVEGG